MGGQRHAPATLPPGKTRYPFHRRLGGFQCRSGRVQKISPPGTRSPDRPALSESLYRLSYPGPPLINTYLLHGAESFLRSYWCAVSQEIPRISRNPKVHYRTHKRPPPVSILGQHNPVPIHTSHLLEIRSNIIRPSTPRSPQ